MPLSETVTLSHGREFGGSNPGIRLDDSADPVALDPGFFTIPDATTEVTGDFVKATFRTTTAWLHVNTDLWLANIGGAPTGARTDLQLDLYSPTTTKWCRLDFSGYQTISSRSDGLAQINFNIATAVPTVAGRTYQSLADWATEVEAALPHDVDITFMSASSKSSAPPAPALGLGIALGGRQISKVYVGAVEIARLVFGQSSSTSPPDPDPIPATVPSVPRNVKATPASDAAQVTVSWDAPSDSGGDSVSGYRVRYKLASGSSWTQVWVSFGRSATLSSLTWGASYDFGVSAVNSVGSSSWSSTVSATVADQPTPVAKITLHSDNATPSGIWSDGTTMWVLDWDDDKAYAYTLATGSRVSSKEFALLSANSHPRGIWSDGTTMWVADSDDDRVYAYRDTSKAFSLASANTNPTGIWSDGTTMWVADLDDNKVYAYTLSNGARDTSKEFSFASANAHAVGIWSDGTTMWVSDSNDVKVYAYTLSNGARDTSKEFNFSLANAHAAGLWSDGTIMWVGDVVDDVIYSYVLATGALRT